MSDDSKQVLIVEDEQMLRDALITELKNAGFSTLQASNGKEALDVALKERPSLILLDQLMPVMDGTTMLEELRKDDWGRGVPVIMMTNMSQVNTMNASIKAGVNDFVLKADVELEKIVDMVKERLG